MNFRILFIILFCLIWTACWTSSHATDPIGLKGQVAGVLSGKLGEISGLAHCQTTPDQLWAINDSGNGAFLYSLSLQAKLLHTYRLRGDKNEDWEDLSCGRCLHKEQECLYIGDIGNNNGNRKKLQIYIVPLPVEFKKKSRKHIKRKKLDLVYPDKKKHNAEALLVHPSLPRLIIVTKENLQKKRKNPRLYIIDFSKKDSLKGTHELKIYGKVPLTSLVTTKVPNDAFRINGGDFSSDGKSMFLISSSLIFKIPWPFSEEGIQSGSAVWKNVNRPQIESIAVHLNGNQFWLASERKGTREPLILMDMP